MAEFLKRLDKFLGRVTSRKGKQNNSGAYGDPYNAGYIDTNTQFHQIQTPIILSGYDTSYPTGSTRTEKQKPRRIGPLYKIGLVFSGIGLAGAGGAAIISSVNNSSNGNENKPSSSTANVISGTPTEAPKGITFGSTQTPAQSPAQEIQNTPQPQNTRSSETQVPPSPTLPTVPVTPENSTVTIPESQNNPVQTEISAEGITVHLDSSGLPTSYTTEDGTTKAFTAEEIARMRDLQRDALTTGNTVIGEVITITGEPLVAPDLMPVTGEIDTLSDEELAEHGIRIINADQAGIMLTAAAVAEGGPLDIFKVGENEMTVVVVTGPFLDQAFMADGRYDGFRDKVPAISEDITAAYRAEQITNYENTLLAYDSESIDNVDIFAYVSAELRRYENMTHAELLIEMYNSGLLADQAVVYTQSDTVALYEPGSADAANYPNATMSSVFLTEYNPTTDNQYVFYFDKSGQLRIYKMPGQRFNNVPTDNLAGTGRVLFQNLRAFNSAVGSIYLARGISQSQSLSFAPDGVQYMFGSYGNTTYEFKP